MGFVKSLNDAKARQAERANRGDFTERPKVEWASLKNDGDSAKVIPLQELDEGSPNYNAKLGKGLFVLTHSNPDDWRKSAECTQDVDNPEQGQCWACDQGWYQKMELLLNVLFDDGNDKKVAVLSKGTGKGSVGKEIMDIAGDADYDNSITDKVFKFTRSGMGTDTTYGFSVLPKGHSEDLEQYADQLFDLTLVPFKVAYERQEAYYLGGKKQEPSEPQTSDGVDQDW